MTDFPQVTLVDGQPTSHISARDRGLAYGDGLFETIRVLSGQAVLLDAHFSRLLRGCDVLGIASAGLTESLQQDLAGLALNTVNDGVLKIIVTRGSGGRGYRPPATGTCRRVMSLQPYTPNATAAVEGISVMVCRNRLGMNPSLAGVKHLNRLEQVLASAELSAGMEEGLMLDSNDRVIEGTRSNLFLYGDGQWMTPKLDQCGVAGVMREFLLNRQEVKEVDVTLERLAEASEIFVCNSVFGIYPVIHLTAAHDTVTYAVGKRTLALQRNLNEQLGTL